MMFAGRRVAPFSREVYLCPPKRRTPKNWGCPTSRAFREVGLHTTDALVILILGSPRSNLHLQYFPVVDFDRAGFPKGVRSKTAPLPKLRRGNQSALHWITMHVTQFFGAFVFRPNIEIVEAFLPDVLRRVVEETVLLRIALPFRLCQHSPRKAEFERLHHNRRVLLLRFADQKMDMLRHNHISDNDELVATAHLLQHGQKQITTPWRAEQGLTAITTAGDEV